MKQSILLAVTFAVVASVQSIPRELLNTYSVLYERNPQNLQPGLFIIDTYPSDLIDHQNEQEEKLEAEREPEANEELVDNGFDGAVIRVLRSAEADGESFRPNVNRPNLHGAPVPPEEIPADRVRRSPKKGRGRIFVRGEAGRGTGRKTDVGVHLGAEYRFRRSVDEEDDASEYVNLSDVHEATPVPAVDLPFERVRRSPKKGRGRIFIRGEAGQSTGRKADVGVHLGAEYRFRRSVDEEHDEAEEVNRPDIHGVPTEAEEVRVRRSPKEPARGEVVVEGSARKGSSTRGRTEGQIYVGGRIRFRRSPNEEPISEKNADQSEIHGIPETRALVGELVGEAVEQGVVSEEKDNLDLLGPAVISRYPGGTIAVAGNTVEEREH